MRGFTSVTKFKKNRRKWKKKGSKVLNFRLLIVYKSQSIEEDSEKNQHDNNLNFKEINIEK